MAQENGGEKKPTPRSAQGALIKALNHPDRVKALTILSERVASPKEISDQLGIKLTNIGYHVRVLHDLGLIELVEKRPVRGAVAHFYKAVEPQVIANSVWQKLSPEVRSAFSGYVLEVLMNDAVDSLVAGLFDRRKDRHLSRTPVQLDEKGWRKVSEIQTEAEERILRVQGAAVERINNSESEAIHAIVGMFCFEVAPPVEG